MRYIDLNLKKNLSYYYLTNNNELRKKHFISEFNFLNINEVQTIQHSIKHISITLGLLKVFNTAMKYQDEKNFKPFSIMEDDIKKYREFPNTLTIPENCDILFIGLSRYGIRKDNSYLDCVYYEHIDNDIIKIYNMLSNHGIIICSIKGALIYQKALLNALYTKIPHDVILASLQHYSNIYALKVPLVYQYPHIGGVPEEYTKVEFTKECNVKDYSEKYVFYGLPVDLKLQIVT